MFLLHVTNIWIKKQKLRVRIYKMIDREKNFQRLIFHYIFTYFYLNKFSIIILLRIFNVIPLCRYKNSCIKFSINFKFLLRNAKKSWMFQKLYNDYLNKQLLIYLFFQIFRLIFDCFFVIVKICIVSCKLYIFEFLFDKCNHKKFEKNIY